MNNDDWQARALELEDENERLRFYLADLQSAYNMLLYSVKNSTGLQAHLRKYNIFGEPVLVAPPKEYQRIGDRA